MVPVCKINPGDAFQLAFGFFLLVREEVGPQAVDEVTTRLVSR